MDDLKNLVIQTLETKGILGKIRAQLRSCVFQVVDTQDQDLKQGSGFQWQNPMAKQMLESPEGELLADLVREFLEFYRMDYSLAVYLPEASLTQEPKKRDDLEAKAGLPAASAREPLLLQILKAHLNKEPAPPKEEPILPGPVPSAAVNRTPSPPAMEKPSEEEKAPPPVLEESVGQDEPLEVDTTNQKEKRELEAMEKKLEQLNVEKVEHLAEFAKETEEDLEEEEEEEEAKAVSEDDEDYYNQDFEQARHSLTSDLEDDKPSPKIQSSSMGNDPLVDEGVLSYFDEIEDVLR